MPNSEVKVQLTAYSAVLLALAAAVPRSSSFFGGP